MTFSARAELAPGLQFAESWQAKLVRRISKMTLKRFSFAVAVMFLAALSASAQIRLGGGLKSSTNVAGSTGMGSHVGLNSGANLGMNETMGTAIGASSRATSKVDNRVKSETRSSMSAASQLQSATNASVAEGGQETVSNQKAKDRGHSSNTAAGVNSNGSANTGLGRGNAAVNTNAAANGDVDQQGRAGMADLQAGANASANAKISHGESGKRK
jgi:hypothetical protein